MMSERLYASRVANNIVDYAIRRAIGSKSRVECPLTEEYGICNLVNGNLLAERQYRFDSFNKIFCSQWLNDKQVIVGTKCNQLVVLDTKTGQTDVIPMLKADANSSPSIDSCGIHSIQLNRSNSLLATSGYNPNDVAIYDKCTLEPICVGDGAHTDWIFDLTWIDDQFLVSGSRDTTLALWDVNRRHSDKSGSDSVDATPCYRIKPSETRECRFGKKIRALLYNPLYDDIIVLSLNESLHRFKAYDFKQISSQRLSYCRESVCLSQQIDLKLIAVGSDSHITLLDSRDLISTDIIKCLYQGCAIRSLSFCNNLLTIGTGVGALLFYDVRAKQFLNQTIDHSNDGCAQLKCAKRFVYPCGTFQDYYRTYDHYECSAAIYSHQYDASRTRIFTGGGPLIADFSGSYAAVWN